jgi:hypothetical protein
VSTYSFEIKDDHRLSFDSLFSFDAAAVNLTRRDFSSLQCEELYLTPGDFERAKTLANAQLGKRLTDLRETLLRQSLSTRANVNRDPAKKWPGARVPYVISSEYDCSARAIIAGAITEWESKTCIRFVPKTTADLDYLELTPNDGTNNYCYSHVGRQGGRQYVKMFDTCMSVGQYAHELGHAVGFGHEHQRPDRDKYVRINWENIDPRMSFLHNY